MPKGQINQNKYQQRIYILFLFKRNKHRMIYGELVENHVIFKPLVPLRHLDDPLDQMPTSSAII